MKAPIKSCLSLDVNRNCLPPKQVWLGIIVLTVEITIAMQIGANAATLTVTTSEDSVNATDGVLSLREAIVEAQANDRITFDTSAVDPSVRGHHFIDKDLTIQGPGSSQLRLRSFEIDYNAIVTISGVTINCQSTGIFDFCLGIANLGTLTLDNIVISGKDNGEEVSGTKGARGAIDNFGAMTLINTIVSDHLTIDYGFPGIHNLGTMRLIKSTVTNNKKRFGEAGISNEGTMTLTDSTVSGNVGFDVRFGECPRGGGIGNSGMMSLTNSTVSGNHGIGNAGIINSGMLTLTNSTVSGNHAIGFYDAKVSLGCSGSGINNDSKGEVMLINSTISDNTIESVMDPQGGLFEPEGGGGIFNNGGTVTLSHTIVAGNRASNHPDCVGTLSSLGYNLVGAGTGCPNDGLGDLTVISNNVSTDILGPLQNNGGFTDTHALLNKADNHAIDSGNPAGCLDQEGEVLTEDQRGFPRPNESGGMAICDIGSVELQHTITGDFDQNSCVDQTDLGMLLVAIRESAPRKSSFDLNGDGNVDIADTRKLVTLFTNSRGAPCF